MLVNMLIAMMAKTFDVVWESQAQSYQFVFARTVLSWADKPATPPPLLLLTVPYQAATTVLCAPARVMGMLCGGRRGRRRTRFGSGSGGGGGGGAVVFLGLGGDRSPFSRLVDEDDDGGDGIPTPRRSGSGGGGGGSDGADGIPPTPRRSGSGGDGSGSGSGGEVAEESSSSAPRTARWLDDEGRSPRQLKAQVREFVESHMEDDGAEANQWRRTQAASLAKLARDQERALARLDDKLERALKAMGTATAAAAPSCGGGAVSSIPSLAGSVQPSPNTRPPWSPRKGAGALHSKAAQRS